MSGLIKTLLQVGSAAAALSSVGLGVWLGRKWAPPGSRFNARPVLAGMTAAAVVLLALGNWLGLAWTPPEREMGDVYRIMYVHVPAMWMAHPGADAELRLLPGLPLQVELEDGRAGRGLGRGGPALRRLRAVAGLHLGQAHLGRLLGLGSAAHRHGHHAGHLRGLHGAAPLRGGPGAAGGLERRGGHHRLRQPAHRLVLGALVAQPAPGAVHPEDGGPGHGAGAARQRLRPRSSSSPSSCCTATGSPSPRARRRWPCPRRCRPDAPASRNTSEVA